MTWKLGLHMGGYKGIIANVMVLFCLYNWSTGIGLKIELRIVVRISTPKP